MQVLNETGPGVRKIKRLLLAYHTGRKPPPTIHGTYVKMFDKVLSSNMAMNKCNIRLIEGISRLKKQSMDRTRRPEEWAPLLICHTYRICSMEIFRRSING